MPRRGKNVQLSRIEHVPSRNEWRTVLDRSLIPPDTTIDANVEHQLITWHGLFKLAAKLRSPMPKMYIPTSHIPLTACVQGACRYNFMCTKCHIYVLTIMSQLVGVYAVFVLISSARIDKLRSPHSAHIHRSPEKWCQTCVRAIFSGDQTKTNKCAVICCIGQFWHLSSKWSTGSCSASAPDDAIHHSVLRCGQCSDNDNEYFKRPNGFAHGNTAVDGTSITNDGLYARVDVKIEQHAAA